MPYILGTRMRKQKEVCIEVLGRAGRYQVIHPEREQAKDPSPLKVKETVGSHSLPSYGPVFSVNRPVRTRMPGGVGAGG